jgi:hypothetical protein
MDEKARHSRELAHQEFPNVGESRLEANQKKTANPNSLGISWLRKRYVSKEWLTNPTQTAAQTDENGL